MKKILILLLPFFLFASEDQKYNLSSDKIIFKDNMFSFEKGFYLEHSFGTLCATQAKINRKKSNFDFNLTDGVKLTTNTNGSLTSESADFNTTSSMIKFYSTDKVNYSDKIKNKDLKIESKLVECNLNMKKNINKLNLDNIYSISFLQNAILSIDKDLKIFSEKAILKKNESQSTIFLYPKLSEFCIFSFKDSTIISTFAKLDLNTLNLEIQNPNGTIKNNLKNDNAIYFSSNYLFWHNFDSSIILKDNVKVVDLKFGNISSKEVQITKKIKENIIKKIIARKDTQIDFYTKNKSKITTKGTIELDHEKNQILAYNLKDDHIVFEDENITISSKKAKLTYDKKNSLDKLFLENDIKFIYRKDAQTIGYGIADKIEYSPKENNIELFSEKSKKVLYYQNDNSFKVSAKQIQINKKEKNDIKATGDVRFTFNVEEENLIHEIFSKYTYE